MALTRSQLADPNCEVTDSDYDAIESAIMETGRGRWFLSEFARRNRHTDTEVVMASIQQLKDAFDLLLRASRPYVVQTAFSTPLPPSAGSGSGDKKTDFLFEGASRLPAIVKLPGQNSIAANSDTFHFRQPKELCA